METIGVISEIRTETVFELKVKDFFSLRDATDTRYDSPEFQCFGISWKLQLYPNGDSRFGAADDWVGVDLIRSFSGCPFTLNYSFTLKSTDGSTGLVNVICGGVLDKDNGRRGFSELIRRSELMERKAVYAPSDEITIICTLTLREDMLSGTTATGKPHKTAGFCNETKNIIFNLNE